MRFESRTLGDVCKFIDYRGKTPPKVSEGIPLITAKIIKQGTIQEPQEFISPDFYYEWMRRGIPQKGDVIITTEAPLGEVAQIKTDKKLAFAQRIIILEPNRDILNPNYLLYALQDEVLKTRIEARSSGTTVFGIKSSELKKVEIDLPPINIQCKIGNILAQLDDKIANNIAINKNLEEQAQTIFKSWFVDFEPFGGEMPTDWRYYKLSEFLPVITGKKNANVSSDRGIYPFFSCSQDISWTNDYSFEGNAILVAGNGDFNVKFYNGKFEAYQRTYVLIPQNQAYAAWLYYAIQHSLSEITIAARGSVIKFITKGNLENFTIPAPIDIQNMSVINKFSSINETIALKRKENLYLAQLRDTLLPRLMSGEIDVSNIEI